MTPPIHLETLRLRYGASQALSGLSLSVERGEILALLGPSGSGKTSVLRIILGLVAPDAGIVRLDGEPASANGRILLPPEERNLAVVFQDLALWPHLTVHGNLAFGLEARKVSRQDREQRISNMLHRVGLAEKAHRYPGELSGGEQQRVAIARALVLEPRAVLLDEPLSHLDVALKHELLTLFRELLRERGTAAIYVTHDLREAAGLGDRMVVIEAGQLTQAGTLAELKAQPRTPFVESLVGELG